MHFRLLVPELNADQRNALVSYITDVAVNTLQLPAEMRDHVTCQLEVYNKKDIARGGRFITTDRQNVYHIQALSPELDYERKRHLVEHLTNAFCSALNLKDEARRSVFVTLQELRPENTGLGGSLLSERHLVHN
jgi:phenylpyruvate tautomerase PptA (4-oxalocrotonate tautomerase family)